MTKDREKLTKEVSQLQEQIIELQEQASILRFLKFVHYRLMNHCDFLAHREHFEFAYLVLTEFHHGIISMLVSWYMIHLRYNYSDQE